MFECFDQYKKEDPDDLKLKSATEIGDMLLHFAIDKLLAHIRDNNVDGKAFIESLNDKHMIQDETGWSDDEVYQIESVLLKHQTLTESQFKENMDYVLKTKYDEHTLSTRIVDKIKEVILAFDVEALQWNIKTGQSVEEFSDTVMNMMEEVVETRTTSDDQKEYVEDTTIQVIYEAIADCFMFNESSLYRPQWTCSNCSNYNVNKVIGNCINTDLSVCSLCGIKERQSIVLMIRNQPTFLMVNQADSAAAYKTNTSYFMQIISVKVDRFQVKVTANDVASYRRNTVYIKDVAHRNEDAIVVEFNHEDPSVVVDVIVDVKRDGLYHLAIYDYKTATEPYTNSNQIQFQFEYPSVDEEYKPNSIDLSSVFQREGKHKAFEDTKLPALGDTVELRSGKIGTVRFIGPVHFAKGNWIGVELHNASGEHDGAVRGVRYFTCPPTRGIFVKKIKSIQSNAAPIGVYWSMPSKSFGDISYEVVFDDRYEGLTANDVDNILDEIETESKEPTLKSDKDAVTSQINFKIGDRVRLARGKTGLVKFIGETAFAKGEVIGLQLDSWTAAGHDGTVRDKKYFEATQGHGYFTRRSSIVAVLDETFDNTAPETDDKASSRQLEQLEKDTLSKKDTAIAQAATRKAIEFNDDAKEESVVTVTDKDEVDDGESPLIQACRRGDDATVKLLLKTPNIKINQKRKTDGATALFVACREGATQCVRHLLSNNLLFINESKTNGRSPLFIASFFGHHEIVDLLINHSHRMTKQGLNHGIVDVNQCDSKGFTPLFVAAQNGHTKIVTLLLRNAADVNQSEQRGHTPLWISSLRGHVDVVRVLLNHSSIDIDYKDLSGVTPLWAACQNNNSEVVELLLHPRNVVVGGDDSQEKTTESRQGANPNLAKHDGCTPLWIAASRGNSQCIEPLINYGADLNKPDQSQGSTPLFIACQNGKKASVDLLLAANADVNRPRSGDGTTALMMAAHNGHAGIVDVLLKCDADSMQANTTGLNALASAAMQGHAEIVKLMYQHLLNVKNQQEIVDFVNAGDGVNGWTPLHLACMGGHETVIKYLINVVKVDIFKKDYENKTGLEHAWQNGHQAIVAWLSQLEQTWINNNSNAPADNATTTTLPTLDINVNDKVRLKDEKTGIVRWKGQFDGTSIDYYGIELDEPYSNANIGRYPSHNNHFDCAPNRGIFVQIGAIVETLAASSLPIAAATKVQVDDMVRVCHGGTGIVKYIGEIHNTKVIGIVMDDSHPSYGDGTVDGKRYLESEHGRGFFAYPREIKENLGSIQAPEPTQAERTPLIPKLDDHVRLDDGRDGVVQFVGITEFSNGETMVGLELNDWSPQSTNGTVNGKEYFDANPGRGYFVNTQSIAHILGDDDTDAKEKEKDKEEEPVDLKLRDRIVTTHGTGIVRFMGGVHFDEREMIGIELDRWSPNGHNGIIHGHKYFHSTDGHGWFIRNNSAQVLKNLTPTERRRESQTTTKDRTRRGSVIITNIPPTMKVGDRIILDTGARGQLVFIGNVAFCAHEKLLGIVLDEWSPNAHNGSIAGKPYFTAPDGQGLLVPISAVQEHIARERQEEKAPESEEEKATESKEKDAPAVDFKIGDRVKLKHGKTGVVRYIGTPNFSDEELLGVELDTWSPNAGNGTINGERIFETDMGRAYFTPTTSLLTKIARAKIEVGSYCRLKGLLRVPKFNGKTVKVVTYVEKKGRWKVKLLHAKQEKKYLGVREENLEPILDWEPLKEESNVESLTELPNIGDKVKTEQGMYGVVKFIGDVDFKSTSKSYIGLELEQWHPNAHNGTVKDRSYFEAADGRGYFVRLENLVENLGHVKTEKEIEREKYIKKSEEEKKHTSRSMVTSLPYSVPLSSVPTSFKVITVCNLNGTICKSDPSELIMVALHVNSDEKETHSKDDAGHSIDSLIQTALKTGTYDLICPNRMGNEQCPCILRLARMLITYKRWLFTVYNKTKGKDDIKRTIHVDIGKFVDSKAYETVFMKSIHMVKHMNSNDANLLKELFVDNVDNINDINTFLSMKRREFAFFVRKSKNVKISLGVRLYDHIMQSLKAKAQTKEFGRFLSDIDMYQVNTDYHHILNIHINKGTKTTVKNVFRFFEYVVHSDDADNDKKECRSIQRRQDRVAQLTSRTHVYDTGDDAHDSATKNIWKLKQFYHQSQLDMIHTFLVHSNWETFVQRYTKTQNNEEDEYNISDFKSDDTNAFVQNKDKYVTDLLQSSNTHYGFGIDHSHPSLSPIYESIHDEMTSNALCALGEPEFQHLLVKSIKLHQVALSKLYREQFIAKYYDRQYNIARNESIGLRHILSIVTYTDMSDFCTAYRSTYRMIEKETETHHVTARHRQLYFYSRTLFEAIQFFGQSMEPSLKVYHGLNKVLHFESFAAFFNQPISTTTDINTAFQFANGKGIILTLKSGAKYANDPSRIPKYLAVSWLSCFPNENEKLFYGAHVHFKIHNIIEAHNSMGHSKELALLNKFQNTVRNKPVNWSKTKKQRIEALVALIKKQNIDKTSTTSYGKELFDYFCTNPKATWICIRSFQSLPDPLKAALFFDDKKRVSLMPILRLFPNLTQYVLNELEPMSLHADSKHYVEMVLTYIKSTQNSKGNNYKLDKIAFKSSREEDGKEISTLKKLVDRYSKIYAKYGWNIQYQFHIETTHNLTMTNKNYTQFVEDDHDVEASTEKRSSKHLRTISDLYASKQNQIPSYFMQVTLVEEDEFRIEIVADKISDIKRWLVVKELKGRNEYVATMRIQKGKQSETAYIYTHHTDQTIYNLALYASRKAKHPIPSTMPIRFIMLKPEQMPPTNKAYKPDPIKVSSVFIVNDNAKFTTNIYWSVPSQVFGAIQYKIVDDIDDTKEQEIICSLPFSISVSSTLNSFSVVTMCTVDDVIYESEPSQSINLEQGDQDVTNIS